MRVIRKLKAAVVAAVSSWKDPSEAIDDEDDCDIMSTRGDGPYPSMYTLTRGGKYGMPNSASASLLVDGSNTIHAIKFEFLEVAMFLASVFCKITGYDRREIGCIYDPTRGIDSDGDRSIIACHGVLIFDLDGYTKFNEWLVGYEARFPSLKDRQQALPVIRNGETVTGTFVNHNLELRPMHHIEAHGGYGIPLPENELFDEWIWVVTNASSGVRITETHWVFENPSDALIYQLQLQ
jgi:hypothetical protein